MQPLLQWQISKCYILWVGVHNFRYPACNAHVPHCLLWPIRLYNIFYIITQRKRFSEIKFIARAVFFSTTLSEKYLSKKNCARYDKKCIGLHIEISLFFWDLNKLGFSRQIFEKYSNVKFHEDSSSVRRGVPCWRTNGQTDWRDEANSCFSQFCERS